ncbi:MAG TPA: glycosyltransferase family 2 protein [Pleomorphomonadaceae bacterium]|nr:glycosyltransferase family 2 protein [Pleomorphomonadaceae bacterium]
MAAFSLHPRLRAAPHPQFWGAVVVPPPTVTVIIPALNERENLRHVLPRIPPMVNEVILVDGASTDGTVEAARQLLPSIRIVQQDGEGKGAALRSGFAAATGDIIVMLDADGSTDPAEIPYFVHALLAGAEFAKGSRFLHGGGTEDMPYYRRLGNGFFVHLVRRLYGGRYTDLCYGYNAFWRHLLPQLELDGDGFEIETMINIRALRAQFRIREVPSFEARRVMGVGRLRTIPDGWRVLRTILRERHRGLPGQPASGRSTAPSAERRIVDATLMPRGAVAAIGIDPVARSLAHETKTNGHNGRQTNRQAGANGNGNSGAGLDGEPIVASLSSGDRSVSNDRPNLD